MMKSKLPGITIAVLFTLTVSLLYPTITKAQQYFTVINLFNLSSEENVSPIQDFANKRGYYSPVPQGTYKDDFGNELRFYAYNKKTLIDYRIKLTASAKTFYENDLKENSHYWFTSDDTKTIFYTSLNGRFLVSVQKTATEWKFLASENKKGDPVPAFDIDDHNIEIGSYSNFSSIVVKASDKLNLKVTGSISFGPFAGYGGPDGINGFEAFSINAAFKHGALLGRIGENGNWFLIGTGISFTAETSGKLFLMVNDRDPRNNQGRFYMQYAINSGL